MTGISASSQKLINEHEQRKQADTMAQGKGYLKKSTKNVKNGTVKPSKKAKAYGHKFSAPKFTKKGSTWLPPLPAQASLLKSHVTSPFGHATH